jgi:hypothetical protein
LDHTLAGLFCLAVMQGWPGCGPALPSSSRIAPDPMGPEGQIDPRGKLRLLGIAADPPEVRPGERARLSALAVIHPRHGQRQVIAGREVGTPAPRGLSHLWLVCQAAPGRAAPEACGLGDPGATRDVRALGTGPTAELTAPALLSGGDLPLVVTLVVADEAQAGGAQGCYDAARAQGGVVPDPNRCVVGIKRVKVSQAARPNRNPGLARLGLLLPDGTEASLVADPPPALGLGQAGEAERHALFVDRAVDAVEREPDPEHEGAERDEVLVAAYFVTSGTLEAGRGGYQDPGCAEQPECPALVRSEVGWTPPAPGSEAALLEAPDGLSFFFAVLRDDRGGLSFQQGAARVQ